VSDPKNFYCNSDSI
jgi:pyruvate kinase